MTDQRPDIISPEEANDLHGLFRERARRTPDGIAYIHFNPESKEWVKTSWSEMASEVDRWRTALSREGLKPGDRVAIWVCNCREWVMMDQAALGLGLVVIPLYCTDRPENIAYILNDAGAKVLLLGNENYFSRLDAVPERPESLERIICLNTFTCEDDKRIRFVDDWLPAEAEEITLPVLGPDDLATIVYTSGTTGNPKGVKLSHRNILWNASKGTEILNLYINDVFLSFLPLSHMFERTAGYYLPMMTGSAVAYSRSIQLLSKDLVEVRPTIMIAVPRIFEKVHAKIKDGLQKKSALIQRLFSMTVDTGWKHFQYTQKRGGWSPLFLLLPLLDSIFAKKVRDHFGGSLRVIVAGGAPLSSEVARFFLGLGLPLLQGYGMTETGPVISCNIIEDNIPSSVGLPVNGLDVMIGENDELLIKSPGVMLGYLNNAEATAETVNVAGWLHTGDKVRIEDGHIFITGRIKEIIVMSNGEKVPPVDIEMAIEEDPLIEQVMVIGEAEAYLAALVVLDEDKGLSLAKELGLDISDRSYMNDDGLKKRVVRRIADRMSAFPGYAKVRRVVLLEEAWTVENELITPTLKLKRKKIMERYKEEIEILYEGH